MRGARGQERSLSVKAFWEDVNQYELLLRIERAFRSLTIGGLATRPTYYSRFTFTVTHVSAPLRAGSPKILTSQKQSVKAWFFASGLSYTLTGAKDYADKAIEDITGVIADAYTEAPDALFFLEFVTVRSYVVKG